MKLIGEKDLEFEDLISPSPLNPRLKGLTIEEPSIKALADSIAKDGQLQAIIVRKVGEKYEVDDGDRRVIAIIKVLKRPTIRAKIYEMNDLEAMRVRLVANIMREDLSPVEKGKYCREIFTLLAEQDKLNDAKAWESRMTRSKYLASISADVGVEPKTIINWIRLWTDYSPEAQALIAKNKEDLRNALIPPTFAWDVADLSRRINADPTKTLLTAREQHWTSTAVRHTIHAIKSDAVRVTPENVNKIVQETMQQKVSRVVIFDKEPYITFGIWAKEKGIILNEFIALSLKFALQNRLEFERFLLSVIQKK